MDFTSKLLENITQFDSWFDVASFSYDYLKTIVGNQPNFIYIYIQPAEQSTSKSTPGIQNPNATLYLNFSQKLYDHIQEYDCEVDIGTEKIVEIWEEYDNALVPYAQNSLNHATLIYALIDSIARYHTNSTVSREGGQPLNQNYAKQSFLYGAPPYSLIDDAKETLGFRKIINSLSFQTCFKSFTIFDQNTHDPAIQPPKIITLDTSSYQHVPSFIAKKTSRLRIMAFPFNNFTIDKQIKFYKGNAVTIAYTDAFARRCEQQAIELLKVAIANKANIVIFPEFLCPPSAQTAIARYLKQQSTQNPQSLQELILVVAGTAYTQSHANVLTFLDRSGMALGTYHKISPYEDDTSIEYLSGQDRECTLVDVIGMGRVAPAICRDIPARTATYDIVQHFLPFLLLIPTYSKSVMGGFSQQFSDLTNTFQVTAVLCNSCGALKDPNSHTINLVSIPYKKESTTVATMIHCIKSAGCASCQSEKNCGFILDFDFSAEAVARQEVIKSSSIEPTF
ncbi:hypothetical protein RFF05_14325 [Bengtsoniella intestinalis]|uniref:hypothetical protein n=1 Tax=Bengtsoniella intestinalis TaxID=3073143 RepID=UPI00391F5C9F